MYYSEFDQDMNVNWVVAYENLKTNEKTIQTGRGRLRERTPTRAFSYRV